MDNISFATAQSNYFREDNIARAANDTAESARRLPAIPTFSRLRPRIKAARSAWKVAYKVTFAAVVANDLRY